MHKKKSTTSKNSKNIKSDELEMIISNIKKL